VILNGIDLSSLAPQLEAPAGGAGKTLLLDADFIVYQSAATVKTLPTAIRRFYTLVMTEMFLTGCTSCRAYITPTGSAKCNRYFYPTVLKYQDQRHNRVELPLRQPLKTHLIQNQVEYADKGIEVMCSDWFEADDLLIQDSYALGDSGLLSSPDKDLRLTPYPWWDAKIGRAEGTLEKPYGYLYWDPDEASPLKGRGTAFFWAQMLMGDQADNVKGITKLDGKLCGPRGAFDFLIDITDETEAANAVVSAYARNGQDVLAEAQMLWLRRTQDDCAYKYLMEVLTAEPLIEWVKQLHRYHQEHIKYVQEISEYGETIS
jgi:hypothetical protein